MIIEIYCPSSAELDCNFSRNMYRQKSESSIETSKCSHVISIKSQGTQTETGKQRRTMCTFTGKLEVRDTNLLHPGYTNRRIRYAFNFKQASLSSLESNHSSPTER